MTIEHVLKQAADRWPESEALVEGERRLTYRELANRVARFATGLRTRGIAMGDGIAIFAENSIEQVVAYFAVQSLGAVAVPVNHRLSAGELVTIVTDAEATTLVCDEERLAVVNRADDDLPTVETIVTTRASNGTDTLEREGADGTEGIEAVASDSVASFESVVADGTTDYPDVSVDLEEPALMMHTSGTTGRPKLVVIDHRGQLLNSMACIAELDYDHADTALHIAPLSHSAGYLNLLLPCVQVGATHVLQSTFDPERTLKLVEAETVTVSLGVPSHFQKLRGTDLDADTSSLRTLVTSGAPLAQSTVDWVVEHLCESFVNVYGLTETTGLVTISRDIRNSDGEFSIGEPFLTVKVRLIKVGEDVPPDRTVDEGERGQIVVRSPKVMQGYHGRPEETADALRNGWLYTGDVAVRRGGVYYLVDRADNLVISGGENVYPQEVESVLDDHPAVVDSAAVGTSDETLGEVMTAYVVSRDPTLTVDDVAAYWRRRTDVADFKRPRELVLVDSIPRNQSGKVHRETLVNLV